MRKEKIMRSTYVVACLYPEQRLTAMLLLVPIERDLTLSKRGEEFSGEIISRQCACLHICGFVRVFVCLCVCVFVCH